MSNVLCALDKAEILLNAGGFSEHRATVRSLREALQEIEVKVDGMIGPYVTNTDKLATLLATAELREEKA